MAFLQFKCITPIALRYRDRGVLTVARGQAASKRPTQSSRDQLHTRRWCKEHLRFQNPFFCPESCLLQ